MLYLREALMEMIGIPLYGRAFEDTNGIGSSYNGVRNNLQFFHHCFSKRFNRSVLVPFKLVSIPMMSFHWQVPK